MIPRSGRPGLRARATPHRVTRPRRTSRDVWGGRLTAIGVLAIGVAVCPASHATDATPDQAVAGGGPANAIQAAGILSQVDALLAGLDARIEDIRAQAEKMLDHADAATDSDEQMRFEEMYGRLAEAAAKLEEERDRLRSMRDELAAAAGGQRP